MKRTIKQKIIFSFCSMLILMLVSQIVFNMFFARSFFISQSENELENVYAKIKNSYTDNIEDIYYLVEEDEDKNGFSIQIFSENELIYSSSEIIHLLNNDRGMAQSMVPTIQIDGFSEEPEVITIDTQDLGGQSISIRGKFLYEDKYIYVDITKPLESIDESMAVFTKSSLLIACIILPLGILTIFRIAVGLSKPIKNIESVSDKLAKLNFSQQADEDISTFELANLAKSVNSMSSQLYKSMNELKTANFKLQEDIEYQKKTEASRKLFIANVSHEMKTPLALLQLYCENLKNNVNEIDKDEYCEIIIEETQRLNSIVKDMLNISSIENGLSKVHKEDFSFSQSCENIIYTLNPMFQDLHLHTDIAENVHIKGDRKQLEEAMRNYIINAISHLKTDGVLKISLEKLDDIARFSVYNQGNLIPLEDINDIWDSFYKSDKSRTRRISTNAGLGLYIVRLIVKNHGGQYFVENKDDGVEFSFTVKTI